MQNTYCESTYDEKTEAYILGQLKEMMRDPAYWRDRDPQIIEQVTKGFEALYDEPDSDPDLPEARQGQMANMMGLNGAQHAEDSGLAHVTPGEIVIPLNYQTPELLSMLKEIMGEALETYIVGSGKEQINPESGLPAFAGRWDTGSFLKHFYTGNGRGVTLNEIGLARKFENHHSVRSKTREFIDKVMSDKRENFQTSDRSETNVTGISSSLHSIGNSTFFREAKCNKDACEFTFSIYDEFTKPLGIDFQFWGTPYDINHKWTVVKRR